MRLLPFLLLISCHIYPVFSTKLPKIIGRTNETDATEPFFQAITLNGTLYCHQRVNWCAFSYYTVSFTNYVMWPKTVGYSTFNCSNTNFIYQDPILSWRGPTKLKKEESRLRIHVLHDCYSIYPFQVGLNRAYKVLPHPDPKKMFSKLSYYVDVVLSNLAGQRRVLPGMVERFANSTKTEMDEDIRMWMEGERINVTKYMLEHR